MSVACSKPEPSQDDSARNVVSAPVQLPAMTPDSLLITESGIGTVTLGKPIGSTGIKYERTSDGEGVALVAVAIGADTIIAYLGEEDPSSPVNLARAVESLETMSPRFATDRGVHAGSLITEVEKIYGTTKRIDKSEIESREYITFENQPPYLTFRIDAGSGLFEPDSMTTTRFAPDTRIFSISIHKKQ